MLKKSNKGLVIGLIALIALGGGLFFLAKRATPPQPATPAVEAPITEQQTAPVEVPPAATETTPQPEAPAPEGANSNAPVPATEQPAPTAPAAPPPAAPASESNSSSSLLEAPAALKVDIATAMQDRVIGNADAPVTIIEYASLTCPHCAHFTTKVLPEVKKRLIDTGKAKLIFRDFPLDNLALRGSMMARCLAPEKYFNIIEVLFNNQQRWVQEKGGLDGLAQLGTLAGMDSDFFNACTQNTALETALLSSMQEAQNKYQIKSTPTFIFNDGAEQLSGAQDADKFEEIVNKLTKGK